MNKPILILSFILLISLLTNCKKKEDLNYIDVNLLTGTWEVVESNNLERGCIYEITRSSDLSVNVYEGCYGKITTYYLTATGNPLYDKEYNWRIRYMENYQPLLDLTLESVLDNEDSQSGNCYYYKVTKLTSSVMWWQAYTNEDNTTIKFRRRTDLKIN